VVILIDVINFPGAINISQEKDLSSGTYESFFFAPKRKIPQQRSQEKNPLSGKTVLRI
jgi:hypothetical protein